MAKEKEAPEEKATEEATGEGGEGETGGGGGFKGMAKKKKLLIIIGGVIVVLLAALGGLFAAGVLGQKDEPTEEAAPVNQALEEAKEALEKDKKLYLNIGEFLVNLNVSGKQPSFLKMSATLEVAGEENKKAVEENLPRIKDTFQVYLRELRAEDLKGSAGVFRLREALLLRVNKIITPAQVSDILFEELIVQ